MARLPVGQTHEGKESIAMHALYYYPGNASLLPHMVLREIGAPFELRLVDRTKEAQKSAEYLRL
ncbi:MAG: hypothetical protein JO357_14480, partial [Hyphomicrobiales bacterium]|nr:hypothetical protein [Hyphomicrobiales bacterium]